jgi:hypothetical protein
VALGIVALDMLKQRRLAKRRHIPVQVPHPLVDRGITTADITDVALEVLDIDGIEANDGRVQPDIALGDIFAPVERVGVLGEVLFDAIERFEERQHIAFVGFLLGREAGLVDAVVDVVVGPFVGCFDLGLEVFGEQVDVFVLLVYEVVEFRVEHADDFGGFVRYDRLGFLVVECWDGEASGVVWVDGEVDVAEVCEVWVQGIWVRVSWQGLVFGCEAPALVVLVFSLC